MSRGIFVTGTDTGVGKTLAACALIHALSSAGVRAAPMKPIAAGAREHGETCINDDTRDLLAAAGWPLSRASEVTPVLFREALAPHIAASHEGRRIALDAIAAAVHCFREAHDFVVVEGVGGFRVPLDDERDTVDLARAVGLPVVLVVGLRLGCLNHALLTVQAIDAAGLALAGWIANPIDPQMPAMGENVVALERRIAAPLLARFPHEESPDARALATFLDVKPLLREP